MNNMRTWFNIHSRRIWAILFTDIVIISASYALAFLTRWLVVQPPATPWDLYFRTYSATVPLLLVLRIAFFASHGLYRSGWRYAGLIDALRIIKATVVSSLVFIVCIVLTYAVLGVTYSRFVFAADWVFVTFAILGTRFSMRIKKEVLNRRREGRQNVLIVGAGSAGVMLLRQILSNQNLNYYPRGFIDDEPKKQGMLIQGVPVIGTRAELPTLIHTLFIEEVLIAIPSASGKAIREIMETCNTLGVRFKTLPSVSDIVDGKVTISDLRDVDILDLLRREPIQLDTEKIKKSITGRCVLVTGAGGSIGSELCRQIALYQPAQLVLVELSEFNLYQISGELKRTAPDIDVYPYIADIKNESRLRHIFEEHRPARVFHAAAYKHVPIMERNPVEAVLNNVKGTMQVIQEADRIGCEECVMISTDKAVRPTSIMGATKRVAEKYVQAFNTISSTRFISVRFGNVLGSSGSVLPLFKEQIIRGGPVTVTHPEVSRYFMLIPEAAQLVLEAATLGENGDIFILDMGQPVRILELARHVIRLMGKTPNADIDIIFTGLRPGEKLHEELVYDGTEQKTRVEKIFVTRSDPPRWEEIQEKVADLIAVSTVNNIARVYECLRECVPEYAPQNSSEQPR